MLTALVAGLAVASWWPPRRRAVRRPRGWMVLGGTLAGCLLLPIETAVLAALGAALLVAGMLLWRERARRRRARRTKAAVIEACEQLAAELAAGQPAGSALERVAGTWHLWRPVAEAHRMGGDVPGALRVSAAEPGAADLRWVAAAWQVAHRTGQGLAEIVDGVALELRGDDATRAVVEGELASARATAKLIAALPVAAMLLGSGLGGNPWSFLLASGPGLACLAAGLAFGGVGLWWIERIARAVERP